MRGDTYRYGNLFSSSPAVGFWAVIAVSGSVALLTFWKKRLWSHHHHHHHVSTTPCICNHISSSSNGSSGDDDVGTSTSLALDCDEVQEKTLESSSKQNTQQVDDDKRISKQVVNHGVVDGDDDDDDDKKMPKQALQSSLVTSSGKKARPVVLKKVRFAPDVVEPSGDGHEYRCRNQAIHNAHSNKVYHKKQEHEGLYHSNALSSHRSKSLGSKARTTAKPCLPENRMMLYGGMHRYKTLLALHWG